MQSHLLQLVPNLPPNQKMNLFFTIKKIMETVQSITAITGKDTGIEGIQAEIEDQITPHHKEEEVMTQGEYSIL